MLIHTPTIALLLTLNPHPNPDPDPNQGLLWAPTQRMTTDGPFATYNRPPTRLFWWFSHGTPVIGHSMQSYLEVA